MNVVLKSKSQDQTFHPTVPQNIPIIATSNNIIS